MVERRRVSKVKFRVENVHSHEVRHCEEIVIEIPRPTKIPGGSKTRKDEVEEYSRRVTVSSAEKPTYTRHTYDQPVILDVSAEKRRKRMHVGTYIRVSAMHATRLFVTDLRYG